jgi:NADH-quinone oxidoreductase subunit L
MNIFVSDVWVIPLMPLLAFILNIFVIRPFDVATRDKGQAHHDEAHGAAGTPEQSEAVGHATPDIATLVETSYVSAMDVMDTHIDTPAAINRAARNAQKTSGGAAFVKMMNAEEAAPHHPHGSPTIFARLAGYVAILAMLVAFIWSVGVVIALFSDSTLQKGTTIQLYNWFDIGNLNYGINFYVDSLTAIMLIVVTGVSMLVQFYSQEYIESEEPRGYARFFAWLSLFTLSMLILVLAANFLLIYIGWELVGLCSYLLIGFLAKDMPKPEAGRPSPGAAAVKAFVTTRIGDFGFLIGILILFTATGTFTFTAIPAKLHGADVTLLTIAMILVFCGAVGKSAQFPLHVWLPDAMEGPTPVSALIHAATMVAAGVYLVARTFILFKDFAGPEALQVVAYIGGFTAILAASIALVQVDVKRVLAYSTISQLGYMFVGLGVSDTIGPGIFHLMTHAFFKALLFLGSGAVLHALAGQQDMRKMGGLASRIPLVAAPFLLATFSIAGFPFFAGFYSKDEIIAQTSAHGYWLLWIVTVFTAFLTAFYMFRLWFLTFGGKGGRFGGWWGGDYRGEVHVHKPGIRLWLPLVILAVPSVIAGYWGWSVIGGNFNAFVTGNPGAAAFDDPFTSPLTYVGVGASLLGILLAWAMYGVQVIPQNVLTRNPLGKGVYAVLFNKYYLDEIYMAFVRFGVMGVSLVAVGIDRFVIDGIINGAGNAVLGFGRGLRRSESGRLQNYGAAIFGGALLIAAAFFAVVYFANK